MRPAPLETYMTRLARELKIRGVEDARIVEEARQHLVDAVEDGRRRGLSIDAAEHEALERFGAPETIAAHVVRERERGMNRFAVLLGMVWLRKWWMLVPTVVTALVTSVVSYYFLPTRSPHAAAIRVAWAGALAENERLTASGGADGWLQISEPMSISSLEKLIADVGLSNRDINVNLLAHDPRGGDIRAEGTVRFNGSKR
jgi:HAAS domain-containing protein